MVTITGASGKTGSKTARLLLARGEKVRVVGRSAANLGALAQSGAQVCLGDQTDRAFLTDAFRGADAVYALIPPRMDVADVRAYYNELGDVLVSAIRDSGVRKVVFLSSLGAERTADTGPVLGLHDVEAKLSTLKSVDIVMLRPGYFMENTLWNIGMIKGQGINGNPTAPDAPVYMVATRDIATKAADLLHARAFTGHTTVDIYGHRLTYREATSAIGAGIGKPDLPYVQFGEADAVAGMMGMGLSRSVAESYVDLARGLTKGEVRPTAGDSARPNVPTTFDTFVAEEFVPAYRS